MMLNLGAAGALRLPVLPVCDVKRRAGKRQRTRQLQQIIPPIHQ